MELGANHERVVQKLPCDSVFVGVVAIARMRDRPGISAAESFTALEDGVRGERFLKPQHGVDPLRQKGPLDEVAERRIAKRQIQILRAQTEAVLVKNRVAVGGNIGRLDPLDSSQATRQRLAVCPGLCVVLIETTEL